MSRSLPSAVAVAVALCGLLAAAPPAQAGSLLVGAHVAQADSGVSHATPDPVIRALPLNWFADDNDDDPIDDSPLLCGWAPRVASPAPGRSPHRSPSKAPSHGPAALLSADGVEPLAGGGRNLAPDGRFLPEPLPTSIFHPPRAL